MTIQFDAIGYAQQLEAAGVPQAQAEVHARTLAHVVGHFVVVPADVAAVKTELSHAIAQTETRLRAEIHAAEERVRGELHSVEASLRDEIHAVEARLNRRIDRLEDAVRQQRWVNGVIMALLVGLYVQSYLR